MFGYQKSKKKATRKIKSIFEKFVRIPELCVVAAVVKRDTKLYIRVGISLTRASV